MSEEKLNTPPIEPGELRRGALVRWVVDYHLLAADHKGNVWPHNPKYEYGVVTEVSKVDPTHMIILSTESGYFFTAQLGVDAIEIISNAPGRVITPTPEEVERYKK